MAMMKISASFPHGMDAPAYNVSVKSVTLSARQI